MTHTENIPHSFSYYARVMHFSSAFHFTLKSQSRVSHKFSETVLKSSHGFVKATYNLFPMELRLSGFDMKTIHG